MECPRCHKMTNTNETDNKYFIDRNSAGIPFFKCEECGSLFYVDKTNETAHPASRGGKGSRFVPITYGFFALIIVGGIFWFFGSNIITWIICGVLLCIGWSSIKIGLFGSQKLIDEMCLDDKIPSSREAKKEWQKINKVE